MKNTLKYIGLLWILVAAFPIGLIPVRAESFTISSFDATLDIKEDGTISVTEQIQTNFSESKHGIYRNIPTLVAQNNERVRLRIIPQSVTRDGQPEKYTFSENFSAVSFQIGEKELLIEPTIHTYTIRYSAVGALRQTSSGQVELAWNVTGDGWDTPITRAGVAIHIPTGQFTQWHCYIGIRGSTTPCSSIQSTEQTVTALQFKTLQPLSGLTVAASYPTGVTQTPTVPVGFDPNFLALSSLILALIVDIFFAVRWYKLRGSDVRKMRRSLPPEYEAPDGLTPIQCHYIYKEHGNVESLGATCIDLARRGYLTITREEKKGLLALAGTSYRFTRTEKALNDVTDFEKKVINFFLPDGVSTYTTFELRKRISSGLTDSNQMKYSEINEFVERSLIEKKYFHEAAAKTKSFPLLFGVTSMILSGIFLFVTFSSVAFISHTVASTQYTFAFSGLAAGLILGGLFWILISSISSRRTEKGVTAAEKIHGYKQFLRQTEKYRQPWLESEGMFEQMLPYALALGVGSAFIRQMQHMYPDTPVPVWYTGSGNFTEFTKHINNFATTSTNTVAPAGSSSGGGGSSGGGFGGGGGGSW